MLLLAGLMGVMAIGATAFFGMTGDEDDQDILPQDMAETGAEGADASGQTGDGTSIMDVATSDDPDDAVQDPPSDSEPPDSETVNADLSGSGDGDASTGEDTFETSEGSAGERIVAGTDQDDSIAGTGRVDLINGYEGDDTISGGDSGDELFGRDGEDHLSGDDGDDTLNGDRGDDTLLGGAGQDLLNGHGDDDAMYGGADADTLFGGEGEDSLDGGDGDDVLHGSLGDDNLTGGDGADTVFGGWGDDTISGIEQDESGADTDDRDYLNGGGGDDVILAGADDIVTTGEGADRIILGDWLNEDHQAEILDFSNDEDALMIVYDDTGEDVPEVSFEVDDEDPGKQYIVFNGERIAVVNHALALSQSHVTLIGQSGLDGIMGR